MLQACRSCGSADLAPVIDLGDQPLANDLLLTDQQDRMQATYPLAVVFCHDCGLVQITQTVPPADLFTDYPYFSSVSETVLNNARDIAQRLLQGLEADETNLIVEIASNDGYLLRHYRDAGFPVLGIEPAQNIAKVSVEAGIETVNAFFDLSLARRLTVDGRQADLLHANNVLAHVPTINDFVAGIAHLLAPQGTAVIEVPYVRDLVEHLEFDTIYHEHLFYFSLTSASLLFARHGLAVWDVERIPIHGGSLRLFVRHGGYEPSARVSQLFAEEAALGMNRLAYFAAFADRVAQFRQELLAVLKERRNSGHRMVGYGAAAKASTLMNYCGIDERHLDYVVDRSVAKQGRLMPGNKLPIHDPSRLLEDRPDGVLILAWNMADEIIRQQAAYHEGGGAFIVPIPEMRIV